MSDIISKLKISEDNKNSFVSSYTNPFQSDKIKKIEFTIEKSYWTNDNTKYESCIRFSANNTTAYHRIEAESFDQLIKITEEFIKNL